jgi:hypothetical protein
MYKLQGTIKAIGATQKVSEKFSKRDLVVTDTSSMYPQDISFQLAQDKCEVLDRFKVGDTVEVSFNLRGREWSSPAGELKYFNTLDAWRVELTHAAQTNNHQAEQAPNHPVTPASSEPAEDDDLPF